MARGAAGSALRDRLVSVLRPVVTAAGYDLEDVVVTPAGKRRLLRVVVDRDGGVDLDGVAELAHAASEVLDGSDTMGDAPYVLEVTSPGVDRPLTEPRHWRRAVGRLVTAHLRAGGSLTGRVVSATDDAIGLDTAGGNRDVALDEITRGVVQLEFSRSPDVPPAPGDDRDDDSIRTEEARA